jgi:hypothetical protein
MELERQPTLAFLKVPEGADDVAHRSLGDVQRNRERRATPLVTTLGVSTGGSEVRLDGDSCGIEGYRGTACF